MLQMLMHLCTAMGSDLLWEDSLHNSLFPDVAIQFFIIGIIFLFAAKALSVKNFQQMLPN